MAQVEYSQLLSCVEIQQTFYQPPLIPTLVRWRAESPPDFEYTLKAWMLITHEAKSPTYRRLRRKLSVEEEQEVGSFKWTTVVREAWEITAACAQTLKARMVLFQCPASFIPSRENISNLKKFFSSIDRGGLELSWEPRGDWSTDIVKRICEDLSLWHAVDPFAGRSETPAKCYFRLHGRKGWRYRYEESELEELAMMLPKNKRSYVFFNNIYMTEDAQRFSKITKAVSF